MGLWPDEAALHVTDRLRVDICMVLVCVFFQESLAMVYMVS